METIIISALGSILAALVAAWATYVLTKRREHDSDWRKIKFAQYQEFIKALSGITDGRSSPDNQERFSDAINSMMLVAPAKVYNALHSYWSEISASNTNRNRERHDALLGDLVIAMRADMHSSLVSGQSSLRFALINAGGQTKPPAS